MYTTQDFKTKKELREAIKAGRKLTVFQPGGIFNQIPPTDGTVYLEGPHFPRPHTWYAEGELKAGVLVRVK